jgi:hypothetical protein
MDEMGFVYMSGSHEFKLWITGRIDHSILSYCNEIRTLVLNVGVYPFNLNILLFITRVFFTVHMIKTVQHMLWKFTSFYSTFDQNYMTY